MAAPEHMHQTIAADYFTDDIRSPVQDLILLRLDPVQNVFDLFQVLACHIGIFSLSKMIQNQIQVTADTTSAE